MSRSPAVDRFEQLYAASSDPWHYRTSRYERDKYAATLAALPAERRGRCLEVGCSIGIFTRQLASRCRAVVAIDFSPRALELARGNLTGVDNVELRQAEFPDGAPAGSWDLIVCSEVLYYLDERSFANALVWLATQLERGACVLAVSWTGGRGDEPFRGDEVHDRLTRRFTIQHTLTARGTGYRIDRFEGQNRSP